MANARPEGTRSSPISLHVVAPSGPALANHVACVLNNILYLHGGINKHMSKQPLNVLYSLDLGSESPIWTEIRVPDSPSLSHHACVVIQSRYLLMIGGWTGKIRTTEVVAYDTKENRWITVSTSGFPEGAGLSSHTALVLDDDSVLIVGREGSIRLQRRFGNSWLLRGSVSSGRFTYTEHPIQLASRSGHTMHALGSTLVIVGGRTDQHIELHTGYRAPSPPHDILKGLAEYVKKAAAMAKPPCGRKQHVSASGSGLILVHGGETFDGKSRVPVGDFCLISLKPNVQWYHLGASGVGRAGHVCCVTNDRIIIHGGLGGRDTIHCDTYEIKLTK